MIITLSNGLKLYNWNSLSPGCHREDQFDRYFVSIDRISIMHTECMYPFFSEKEYDKLISIHLKSVKTDLLDIKAIQNSVDAFLLKLDFYKTFV